MSTLTATARSATFKIGWIALLVIAVLMTLNHIALAFFMDDKVLFIGWAAFNLYAVVVLYIPFRRGEQWAWYTSWILVVGFALPIFFDTTIGAWYLAAAGLMALGLLLTRSTFFQKES